MHPSPKRPRLEIIRTCQGIGFSMLGDALKLIDREDVLVDLPSVDSIKDAAQPVLMVPAKGTWNFLPSGDAPGVVGMLQRARDTLGTLDGITVAFDCSGEGFIFDPTVHAELARELARHGLERSRTFLITSRVDGRDGYATWCRQHGQAQLFDPVYSPMQLYYYAGRYRAAHNLAALTRLVAQRSPFLASVRPRKYVCLNFMPRDNRWAVVLRLMQEKVLDQGYVSFEGRSQKVFAEEGRLDLDAMKQQLRRLRVPDTLIDRVDELDRIAPLELEEPQAGRFEFAYGLADHAYYAESYFSIVTESDFVAWAGRRFTEKVLKPIANLQPFVSVATVGVMAELRRLGFQTFSPLIDESYDMIEDHAARLEAAINAALTLIHMSPTQLHDLYVELWPRLLHNYMHFLCMTPALVDQDEALRALSSDAPSEATNTTTLEPIS